MSSPAARPSQAIPMARPSISQREIDLVTQVLRSDVLALGSFATRFEAAVAGAAQRAHAVACSSGTAGLHLSVRALGLREGDEVITTPFSFVASTNCLLYERVVPRFVDIEEDSLGLDPALADAAASSRTRAILPVHVFGRPCRIQAIAGVAAGRGWRMVEDACEGLGSSVNGRPLGSFGDLATFAFYPNKQITTGEGGVVVTDDPELDGLVRSLRNQGRDADGTWLRHVRLGYNYRLDEMSAALGVAQMERRAELQAGRARVASAYERALGDIEWIRLPQAGEGEVVDWFVYVIRLDRAVSRDRVMQRLAERGVPSRPYFSPLHLQPFLASEFGFRPGDFPVAERVAASTLALPFSSRHTEAEVGRVADALREAVGRR